jgi:HAE1 family hydrophobic/amphiphilic exporter-1
VNDVISAAIVGGLLAVVILYFFLRNFWSTVIISFSIPVSVVATFNLMYGTNLTLNIMSLGGIALGVGMLVDNSIVVLENIARHRQAGRDGLTAARIGASEVGTAVSASTLTTVAVFFPLVFVRGIAGQLFRDQALTVTFSLLASLVVAMTLVPMLASLGKARTSGLAGDAPARRPEEASVSAHEDGSRPPRRLGRLKVAAGRGVGRARRAVLGAAPIFMVGLAARAYSAASRLLARALEPAVNGFQRGYGAVESNYPRLVRWALGHRRVVIGLAAGLFAVSIALVPILGVDLIPQLFQGEFRVEFRLPPGSPLELSDEVIREVQAVAVTTPGVATSFSVAGTGNRMDANPDQGGENWGQLDVALRPGSGHADEEAAMTALRGRLKGIPGLQYKFSRPTLFTFRTPVEIEVSGYDLGHLKQVSADLVALLEKSARFADVKSTMESGHPEVQIHFDRERAAALGLAVYQLADRVVEKVRGEVATKYSWRDRKVDVLVRAQDEDRGTVEKIRSLIVNPESDRPVTLESVADITVDIGPSEIRRIDQERVALVTANLRYGDLGGAAEEIDRIVDRVPRPADVAVRLAGQNEEMAVSFRSLQLALLLAVFLVYLVMAAQFESFLHPFVILMTIPLAVIGAVLALAATGSTISVVVLIGAILLAGIVVNNAIVLIDFVNQLRAQGMSKIEALVEGGRLRLRPILMTTVTTVLGLLPLALGIGEGAEIRSPMAITVIGGLTVSTLLTLVVIPVVYATLDRRD